MRVLLKDGEWMVPPDARPQLRIADSISPRAKCPAPAGTRGWYALQVRPNYETRVRTRLLDQHVEAYFPFQPVISRDKRRVFERNLFPGYVFSRFDQRGREAVLALPELIRIVGAGTHALSIPDNEIEAVKLVASRPGAMSLDYLPSAGDLVEFRFHHATMQGHVMLLRQSKKERVRLTVAIQMLGRSVTAEVDASEVRLLQKAAA